MDAAQFAGQEAQALMEAQTSVQFAMQYAQPEAQTSAASSGTHKGGPESDNLFFTDLPPNMTDEQIAAVLGQYGTIVSVKNVSKPMQPWTAALVRYASHEEAKYVQTALNGGIPQGLEKPVVVRYANAPGGGKGWWSKAYGKDWGGKDWGTGSGKDWGAASGKDWSSGYSARSSPYDTGASWGGYGKGSSTGTYGKGPSSLEPAGKGVCTVPMDTIVAALEASGQLPGGSTFVNDDGCIFIAGLPRDCEDIHLYRIFSPFGPIYPKGVRACRWQKGSQKGFGCRGYGFVNFLAAESAQAAIVTLNGAILPDGTTLKVEVKCDKQPGENGPTPQQQQQYMLA